MRNNYKPNRWYYTARFYWLIAVLLSGFSILVFRLTQLQFFEAENLNYEGDRRSLKAEVALGKRGMIVDRMQKPLAISVSAFAIWIDPKVMAAQPIDWQDLRWLKLAKLLGIPLATIQKKVTVDPTLRFSYLSRQVNEAVADEIITLGLSGVYQRREWRRFYPMGEKIAPLIGITDIDGNGVEGVEKSFETLLAATSHRQVVRRGRFGNLLQDGDLMPVDEVPQIKLTIDERLQSRAYQTLSRAVIENRADFGSLVLVDIATGEILALANYPSFNPNNRSTVSLSGLRNHVISDVLEPGSTVKPFVLISALQRGVIQHDTIVDARPFRLNGYEVKDVSYAESLSLTEILEKSSNTAISRIALRLTPQDLISVYQQFGLGHKINLQLLGEQAGYLPREKKHWAEIEKATFSFGYGQMVTPLQLAQAYTTLGNLGRYRPLTLLCDEPLAATHQIDIPAKVIQDVLLMMEQATQTHAPRGGAVSGYRVAAKTGTTKKVGDKGAYIDEYTAYIAGIAPVSQPRFALVVVIDNPKAGQFYGGAVAAPVFSKVMADALRIMQIKPDSPHASLRE